MDLSAIRDAIEKASGTRPEDPPETVGGGCINEAVRLGEFFVKMNAPDRLPMFESEALGLAELERTGEIRVPRPLCAGTGRTGAFLVLEHLPLSGRTDSGQESLGRQLAALHRHLRDTPGWEQDNFIGATAQPNRSHRDWVVFYREERLGHMLRLASERGFTFRKADLLLERLDGFFDSNPPPASLLHGDLWGGNASQLPDGTPVVFDPAVYYGDRETDLAMTSLFGGFGPSFYAAYREAWPLPAGHERRRDLYNLYHILNHAVLFGAGYANQAQSMINALA